MFGQGFLVHPDPYSRVLVRHVDLFNERKHDLHGLQSVQSQKHRQTTFSKVPQGLFHHSQFITYIISSVGDLFHCAKVNVTGIITLLSKMIILASILNTNSVRVIAVEKSFFFLFLEYFKSRNEIIVTSGV